MVMDQLPQNADSWIRRLEARIKNVERHRHPGLSASVADLVSRVEELEGDVASLEGTVTALLADMAAAQADITALETAVDALEADSGWVAFGAITGWAQSSFYRMVGKMVTVRVLIVPDATTTLAANIGTLPAAFRPTETQYAMLYNSGTAWDTDGHRRLAIATTGVCSTTASKGTQEVRAGQSLAATVTFPAG